MICEMFSFYKTKIISLSEKMDEIYKEYDYCLNTLHSFELDDADGFTKKKEIMKAFYKGLEVICSKKVVETFDYRKGINELPRLDDFKYLLEGNCSVVVRPSEAESKHITYISVSADKKEESEML